MAATPHNNTMKIIDSHLHLFALNQGNYDWLKPENPPHWPDKHAIRRCFHTDDLTLSPPLELSGFVHIEAGFDNANPWREIDWLDNTVDMPFSAVAYASLSDAAFKQTLSNLCSRRSVVGIRDILDGEVNAVLGDAQCLSNLSLLADYHLSFDAQLSVRDDEGTRRFRQVIFANPSITFIINHGGWPPVDNDYDSWITGLSMLAEAPNVAIKLSGWEMGSRQWSLQSTVQRVTSIIQLFGSDRVMLASNFPLCTWTHSYNTYWAMWIDALSREFESDTLNRLFCHNAQRFYRVPDNKKGA